jgi:membrane-associated phospholipid phosphatase
VTNSGENSAGNAPLFGLWADPVLLLALLALWIALALVFNGEPEIDRWISSMFFAAQPCAQGSQSIACGSFPAAANPSLQAIRSFFHYLPVVVAIVVVAILARDLAAGRRAADGRVRFTATALAALLIGPGLIVNVFLKEYWGRPRPVSTDLFGGLLPFVPAGQWSNACPDNCSFVSGEASSIFWLVCLIPLWPRRLRGRVALAIVAITVATTGLRVAFGGHYLSDVVLGGLSTLIVFSALAVLVERVFRTVRRA